jgi:hypothetical protein
MQTVITAWLKTLKTVWGVVSTLIGLSGSLAPRLLPDFPNVLIPWMTGVTVLGFFSMTAIAAVLRQRRRRESLPLAVLAWMVSLVLFIVFLWLFREVPQTSRLHQTPEVYYFLTTLPYGLSVGLFAAGFLLLTGTTGRGK